MTDSQSTSCDIEKVSTQKYIANGENDLITVKAHETSQQAIEISSLDKCIKTFTSKKYKLIDCELQLKTQNLYSLPKRSVGKEIRDVFSKILSKDVLVAISSSLTTRLRNISNGKEHVKNISLVTILKFIGTTILLENTASNDQGSLRNHYLLLKRRFPNVKLLSIYMYERIRAKCCFIQSELDRLIKLLSNNSKNCIQTFGVVCVDESLLSYCEGNSTKKRLSESGQASHVVFMPRKPHSEGVLLYHLATFIQNKKIFLPYSIDWCLSDKKSDAGAPSICKKFFSAYRWQRKERVIIVGDSAFGTLSLFEDLHKAGFFPHFSLHSSSFKNEKKVLSENLLMDAHREAINESGLIISAKYVNNGVTSRVLFVGSYAYEPVILENTSQHQVPYDCIIPNYSEECLKNMNLDALKNLSGNKPDIISSIKKYISRIYDSGIESIIKHSLLCHISSSNKSDFQLLIWHPDDHLLPFRELLAIDLLENTKEIVDFYY
ncbi:hypothetical protein WA158_007208 [Blastocystis sp. Blastoise]